MEKEMLLEEIIITRMHLRDLAVRHWLAYELGTWQWYLCLTMIFLPLLVWWKLVDKKRIFEILTLGLLISGISSFLDVLGSEAVLWVYPNKLLPASPRFLTVDTSCLAVVYMLLYQYFPDWRRFLAALTVSALLMSFVVEPLMVQAGMYRLITWRYIYSVPIHILMGALAKGVSEKLKRVQQKGLKSTT